MINKTCPVCKTKFTTYPSQNLKTCSRRCGSRWRAIRFYEANKKKCTLCGKLFLPKRRDTPGLYCGYRCAGKAITKPVIMRMGYRFVHAPGHPGASKQGYYAEHRLVMEKKIGRFLKKQEVVHHINHNPSDNRPENLMLYATAGQHRRLAHPLSRVNGKWGKPVQPTG